jgi:hypothetical protein
MAAGCVPAILVAGRLLRTAARKLAAEVGEARAINVGLASATPLRMSKPGTVRMAPSAEPSVPPVLRGCGPAENCALREPSGTGAGAFALGLSPTIAILTAAADADSGNAGVSGKEEAKGLGRAPRRGGMKSRGAALDTELPKIDGAAIAAFAVAARAGTSANAGAGLSTVRPARGSTNWRGGAFTGRTPSKLPAPVRFRAV